MPAWNLIYRIGVNCTLEDFHREQQVFRSDRLCISYQCTESPDTPGMFSAQVEFNERMSLTSEEILSRRLAEAVPAVRANPITWNGDRYEVQMSTEGPQEGQLVIGAQVSVDEHGRLGTHGTTIGIVTQLDRGNHQARIIIEPGTPLDVLRSQTREHQDPVRFSREELESSRIQLERGPFPLPDPRVLRARQEIMAAEDARVFEALDSFADYVGVPKEPEASPEPRPVFKSRYQRILDSFK